MVVVLRLRGGGCDTGATADGGPAVVLQVGCGCAAAALRRSAVQLYPGCVAAARRSRLCGCGSGCGA